MSINTDPPIVNAAGIDISKPENVSAVVFDPTNRKIVEQSLTIKLQKMENNQLRAHNAELCAVVKEARQYIELGASNALRDGRSSDVGAVLSGLADRMRTALEWPL